MIDKIKSKLIKMYYVKNLTGHMGKVDIQDDKIICYVTKNAICKERNEVIYYLNLRGTTFYSEELKNKYDLNKPIYYIFDDITFDKELHLASGINTHVIIRNCTFKDCIEVIWCAEEITFENNTYYNAKPYYFNEKIFFGCKAKKLNFINEVFMDISTKNIEGQIYFGISARVDELNILNSDFCISGSKGKMLIEAKKTKVKDSIIKVDNMELKSDVIDMENSRISAYKEIIIDNKINNGLDNIDAHEILYNGNLISSNENGDLIISDETIELSKKRAQLISTLKTIRNLALKTNQEKINHIKEKLNSNSISKTLKLNRRMNTHE